MLFDERKNCGSNFVLADGDDIVNIFANHFVGRFARSFYSNAIGKGMYRVERFIFMVMKGPVHAGCTGCLYAINFYVGAQALDGEGYATDEAAAANRHDDSFYVRQLVENLQTDAALTCDNKLIIIRMNKGHACFLLQLDSAVMRFVVGAGNKLHLSAETLGVFHLHNRCAAGHADNAFDAHAGCGQRNALGMVAGAAGDNALGCFLFGQLADFVVGTAHLEAAGYLQVFCLQIEVFAFAQMRCRY